MSKKIDALKEQLAKAKENIVYYSKLINFLSKKYKEDKNLCGYAINANIYFTKFTKINKSYLNFCDILYNNYENSNNNVIAFLNCINNILFTSQRLVIEQAQPILEKLLKIIFFFKYHYLFQSEPEKEIFILTRQKYLYLKDNSTFINLINNFHLILILFPSMVFLPSSKSNRRWLRQLSLKFWKK